MPPDVVAVGTFNPSHDDASDAPELLHFFLCSFFFYFFFFSIAGKNTMNSDKTPLRDTVETEQASLPLDGAEAYKAKMGRKRTKPGDQAT